jgi:hypothetical protein
MLSRRRYELEGIAKIVMEKVYYCYQDFWVPCSQISDLKFRRGVQVCAGLCAQYNILCILVATPQALVLPVLSAMARWVEDRT